MVLLWQMLERTEDYLKGNYKRFCPRNILKLWHSEGIFKVSPRGGWEGASPHGGLDGASSHGGLDGALWDVCHLSSLEGYEQLPSVSLYPLKHREFLRAIISVNLSIGMREVNLKALDRAFSIAFPHATPINKNKKGKGFRNLIPKSP